MDNQYEPIEVNKVDSISHAYFHLNAPYAVSAEFVDYKHGKMDYYLAAPNYFSHKIIRPHEYVEPGLVTGLHQHDAIELMFIADGYMECQIENQSIFFNAGECCCMNKWIRHMEDFNHDFKVFFLLLSDEFIATLQNYNKLFNNHGNIGDNSARVFDRLHALIHNSDYKKGYLSFVPLDYSVDMKDTIHNLFNDVMAECRHSNISSSMAVGGHIMRLFTLLGNPAFFHAHAMSFDGSADEYLFRKIVHTLETRHGNISRQELESVLHYSGDYLNRIVKAHTGKSLVAYRNCISMEHAASMLVDSRFSIAEIMQVLGYNNKTYFYKKFKEIYHMPPQEYQKTHCEVEET